MKLALAFSFALALAATSAHADKHKDWSLDALGRCHDASGKFAPAALCHPAPPKCVKGKLCGNACIKATDVCHKP